MKNLLFISLILFPVELYSQCSGGSNGGAITPTTTWQTVTISAGSYYTFTVSAGSCDTYDFSFCQGGGSASYDTQITIRTNADVYANSYSDDNCSLQSQIIGFVPSGAGTYRVLINSYPCGSSGATATLAYRKTSPGSNANYQYLSNASATGNCIALTSASNNQTGCAWDVNSTLNFASNFSYDLTVNLGSSDAGADGMAFVIQNDASGRCKCGTSGGSMGAGGISNSLTIEIDTYLNTEDRDDGMAGVLCSGGPEPDHLDIWLNGVINPEYGSSCVTDGGERIVASAVPLMSGASIYNIENGSDHILRISWNSSTNIISATVLNIALTTTYGTISYSFNPMTVFGTNTPYFGFTASTGGLNNQQNFCLPDVLLPVEIISYTAVCEEQNVKIEWVSISENQNDFYQLERSINGIDYVEIAKINGALNSNQLKNYSFIDSDQFYGSRYYRLSQTDLDGNRKIIGQPLEVKCESSSTTFLIYPNPANDLLMINNISGIEGEIEIQIIDLNGKIILRHILENDLAQSPIKLNDISQGVYIVNVLSKNTSVQIDKLIIAR